MSGARKRLLAYAAALTFIVGVVGGVVASMTLFVPIDESRSLIEARIGVFVVLGLLLAVAVAYVALPVGVAVLRTRADGGFRHLGPAALSVFGLPLVFVGALYILDALAIGIATPVLFGALFTLVAGILGLVTVATLGVVGRARDRDSVWPFLLNIAVVVVFTVGFFGIYPLGAAFADDHTERRGWAGPNAKFVAEEQPADENTSVLTLTHEAGEPIVAENLEVRGEGFATVEGVDQTDPGRWQGSVSGERPRRGGVAIFSGDSVDIGVTADCEIRLIYSDGDMATTIAHHDCTES